MNGTPLQRALVPCVGLLGISRDPRRRPDEEGATGAMATSSVSFSTTEHRAMDNPIRKREAERPRVIIPDNCKDYKDKQTYSISEEYKCKIDDTLNIYVSTQCKSKRCQCCNMWAADTKTIQSAYNMKRIACNLTKNTDCSTANVVYALTCTECSKTYVGETKQQLRKRMSQHRRNIINKIENTHMITHFTEAHGKTIQPRLRVLETMEADATDEARRACEAKWTLALNTVHPWGLNTNIKGYGAITEDTDPVERRQCPWFRYGYERAIPRGRKIHKKRKDPNVRINSNIKAETTITTFLRMGHDLASKYRWLKTKTMNEQRLLAEIAMIECSKIGFTTYQEIASFMAGHHTQERVKTEKPIYIPFLHVNDNANMINPGRLLRTKRLYPANMDRGSLPKTIFALQYETTLGASALNYNKFLKNLDRDEILKISTEPCQCNDTRFTEFVSKQHGHILTGNMNIVENTQLRKLLEKGGTFRQTHDKTSEAASWACIAAIQTYIHRVVRKIYPSACGELYRNMHNEIESLTKKSKKHDSQPGPDDMFKLATKTKRALAHLQKRYVIVPIDKAACNFAIVCPKLYINIMNKELGVTSSNDDTTFEGNEVYRPTDRREEEILDLHAQMTEKFLKQELEDENRCTPILWASPKFHKNPIKFRFIAGAKKASTKQLSVTLANILYLMKGHWERYTKTVSERKGYNCYWPIDHSGQVLKMLRRNKLPDNNKITIADFSTLYTSFEHQLIITHMTTLIKKLFKHANHKYIAIGKSTYYHSETKRKDKSLTEAETIQLMQFLVKNSYVKYAGKIFHQKSGIPMGANYSPVLANLCLAHMEFLYLTQNPGMGKRLNFTTRYIDDILTIGSDAMKEAAKEIYPNTLPLSFDDTTNGTGHYLDLHIDRNARKTSLYDKRKDFSFKVIRYTDSDSNVPRGTGLNTTYSQAIRLARICSEETDFKDSIKEIIIAMYEKGYKKDEMLRTLLGIKKKYPCLMSRHKIRTKRDVALLIDKIF